MKFVVGIGNPGKRYDRTRHNAGFEVVDGVAGKAVWRDTPKFRAFLAETESATLVKPSTFVNVTGESVAKLAAMHNAAPADVLVVCDDVNLDLGKMRLRASGGPGGHHGLESIIAALGTDTFPRLRVGVRTEGMPEELSGWVLETFPAEERKVFEKICANAVAVCEAWARDGYEAALNRLSRLQSSN